MENKIKFIIIGLAGLLFLSLFIVLRLNSARVAIERERNELAKEVDSLTKKNESITQEIRRLQEQRSALQRQLDKTVLDREEIQKKYEQAVKERDVVIEKLKTAPLAAPVEKVVAPVAPQTNDAYWAGILKAKADLELQLENMRAELKTIQINNEQLERGKSTLDLDLKNLNRENEDLKRQTEYNQKIVDTLSQELVREKNDKFKIQESLKSIKSENEVLRRQLRSLDNRKINLERKFIDLQKENSRLETRLREIEMLLQEKILYMDDLKKKLSVEPKTQTAVSPEKESIELPPIVVRPQELEALTPPPTAFGEGKVLAINRENNFVIINLGQDQGIKAGDTFQVYREQEAIATLEVTQVRRQIAACDIKKENIPVRPGDTIR